MSQATIPDLPFNGTPPNTVLFEISNSGVSESTDLSSIIFGLQEVSEKDQPNGYAGLDGSGLLNIAQIPDLSGTYQILTEKDIANGYAGLDATGLVLLGAIPNLPQSRIVNLVSDLAARELLANKVITVGTPGNDTNYPSEKAVRDALDLKQDSIGFTPENVANKSTDLLLPDNTKYPTTLAITTELALYQLLSEKGAANGYAGLDASSLLQLANFPAGTALQVLRRNAGNTALEFADPGANQTPWTSDIDADTFNLLDGGYAEMSDNVLTTKANEGALRMPNGVGVFWRNAANDDNLGIWADGDIMTLQNWDEVLGDTISYMDFSAADVDVNSLTVATNLQMNGNPLEGGSYFEFDSIISPGVTGLASRGRLFLDSGNANHLTIIRNGAPIDLEAGGGAQTPWTSNIDAAGFNLFNLSYMESNALNPAQSGAVRLGDTEQIMWRNNANNADIGIDVNNDIFNFVNVFRIDGTSTSTLNFQSAVANFDAVNVFSGIDFGSGSITSVTDIEMESDGLILFNGGSVQWMQGTATGVEINAATGQIIDLRINDVSEVSLNATTLDVKGNTIDNVGILNTNATFPSSQGEIRLGDLESIGFRNSTNDGDYLITSDDPTLTFKTWETIEFPQATIIDAGAADLQILSIDMSGDIVVNGFSILQPGLIESNAGTPADGGFIRMGNGELLAWRNFGDTANATLTFSTSDQFLFNSALNVSNNLIKAVLAPVDGTDAANKTYVDNLVNGLAWKDAAVVATTGNISLTGEQIIDTVLTSTSRVLVKDQTLGEDNGVYVSAAGAWARATDADSDVELVNMSIFIEQGTVNIGTAWTQTTDLPITVGTTVLSYAQIGAGPSNPLTTKGDIFGYDTAGARIPVGTDSQVLVADSAESLGVKWQDFPQPLTTKGDLFTYSTIVARLPVGITGQILSANAAETTGLEWINNDPSPLTSKGDIYTFTTVNERLAVGSNGQILTANNAQPTGLEWTTLAAGDVNGPVSSTDNAIPKFDGTGGDTIQNTSVTIDDDNRLTMSAAIILAAAGVVPAGTNTYLREDANNLDINVASANSIILQFGGGGNDYVFTSTGADFSSNTISNAVYASVIAGATITAVGGITYSNGIKQTFNPSTANAGINVGGEGSDPSSAVEGDIYFNNVAKEFRGFNNSVWVNLGQAGGGSQTPWTSNIDAASFDLNNLGIIDFASPADVGTQISADAGGIKLDVGGAADTVQIKINTAVEWEFKNNTLDMFGAGLTNPGNILDSNNNELITFDQVASAVNHITISNNSAGNDAIIKAGEFGETTSGITFEAQLDGGFLFTNPFGQEMLQLVQNASNAVSYLQIVNGPTATGPFLNAISSESSADISLTPKGTGTVNIVGAELELDEQGAPSFAPAGKIDLWAQDVGGRGRLFVGDDGTQTEVALISQAQTLADKTLGSGTIVNSAITWNNFRQIFTPGASIAGINVGEQAADPTVPVNGDLYYQTGVGFRARDQGAWITLSGGGGTGDVVGPASSVNHNIAVFDGATGKLIDGAGSSGFEIIVDTAGQPTLPRNLIFTSFAVAPPAGTTGYIGNYSNEMVINGNLAVEMHIQNVQTMRVSNSDVVLNDLNVLLGTGFAEFEEISTPALPAADKGRLYVKDVSTETHLFFINSSGEDTDLTAHALQTPWLQDVDAAGFNLGFKTVNPITIGQGATDVLSITYLDDTLDAGVRIGNSDGFVSITNESAVVNDAQTVFTMRSGGATTIQNVMNFQIVDDAGTVPALKLNFEDSVGGPLTRPFFSINSGATEYLEVTAGAQWNFNIATDFNDLGTINFANVSTTAAADRVINLDEADRITWEGAAAGTPNSILFTTGDIFQVYINNALQFQITDTSANFLNGLIQGVAGYEFQVGTADIVGTSTDLELNGPTNVSIHIADTQKFSFDTSFLNMNNLHIRHLNSIRGDLSGTPIILKVEEVASAVNYLEIVNAISAEGPTLSANGTATDIDLNLATKGSGNITFIDYAVADTNVQLKYGGTVASATNMSAFREGNSWQVTGVNTIDFLVDDLYFQAGYEVTFQFASSLTLTHNKAAPPTNFAVMLLKGDVDFTVQAGDMITLLFNGLEWIEVSRASAVTPGIDLVGNNMIGVQNIVHDQSAITYNATLAFDFDLDQEQTLAVTGDLTTLTTSNRAAGKSKSIFITGDTVNRTLTFNTSWRTNPATATVTITANTFGLLTFGSKGGAETDVFCAYAEFV